MALWFSYLIVMENSINLSILLPGIPFGIALFIFVLLNLFSRTINRLTKPISILTLLSILSTTFLCLFFWLNNVEGEISLTNYLSILGELNLEIHLNLLTEKIIFYIGIAVSLLILYSLLKLPRKNGYVQYVINIGFLSSLIISSILLLDLNI